MKEYISNHYHLPGRIFYYLIRFKNDYTLILYEGCTRCNECVDTRVQLAGLSSLSPPCSLTLEAGTGTPLRHL